MAVPPQVSNRTPLPHGGDEFSSYHNVKDVAQLIAPEEYVNHTPHMLYEMFQYGTGRGVLLLLKAFTAELGLTIALTFSYVVAAILYPQSSALSSVVVGLAMFSTYFMGVLLTSRVTGAYMNPFNSFVYSVAFLVGSTLDGPEEEAKTENKARTGGRLAADFFVKLLVISAAQIGGFFLGHLLAGVLFLAPDWVGFTWGIPHLGQALWVDPTGAVLVTSFQASMMEATGAFMIMFTILKADTLKCFHSHIFLKALVRAFPAFIGTLLFYSTTGAGFIVSPFHYIVATAYAGTGYTVVNNYVYVLAPVLGTCAAFVIWVFYWLIARSKMLKHSVTTVGKRPQYSLLSTASQKHY